MVKLSRFCKSVRGRSSAKSQEEACVKFSQAEENIKISIYHLYQCPQQAMGEQYCLSNSYMNLSGFKRSDKIHKVFMVNPRFKLSSTNCKVFFLNQNFFYYNQKTLLSEFSCFYFLCHLKLNYEKNPGEKMRH